MGPVICPSRGETEALKGEPAESGIWITCERCGARWERDATPTCPKCGGRDVRPFPEPLIQRARGNAYSVVGESTIYLCRDCDREEIARRLPDLSARKTRSEDPWK